MSTELHGPELLRASRDQTLRVGTQRPETLQLIKGDLQGLKSRALTTRQHRAHKRRHHLRHSHDAVAYGSQNVPVSPVLNLVLRKCDDFRIPFVVISGDRRDGVAQRFGHSSQAQCYYGHLNGDPAYPYPANQPNSSTHEYVNGGNGGTPAFPRMPVGAKLAPQQLGLDMASNAQASEFCERTAGHGLHFFQPYPTGTELHHVCCRMTMDELIRWMVEHGVIR